MTSSTRPIRKTVAVPRTRNDDCGDVALSTHCCQSIRVGTTAPAAMPAAMAIPPMRGIASRCNRRPPG